MHYRKVINWVHCINECVKGSKCSTMPRDSQNESTGRSQGCATVMWGHERDSFRRNQSTDPESSARYVYMYIAVKSKVERTSAIRPLT